MLKGDISNELPKRVIVVMETFMDVEVTVKKRLKVFPAISKKTRFNRTVLSQLYNFAQKQGYTMELAGFDTDESFLQGVMDILDKMGTNPFRYFGSYDNVAHLVSELPYRPEVIGVLDLPTRLLRYGHWGLDFKQL
jgi:hypothetical protein